jgi:nucleoside-diphosphate-sugar epimerase
MEGCAAVVHLAGVPGPARRRVFEAVHVEGTARLLAAARRAAIRRFVLVSSQAVVFGGEDLDGADETTPYPARYIDPYSETKAAAERLTLAAGGDGPFTATSIRPAVVWGRGDTTVLPHFARLARRWPGVPAVGDGANIEATTHVDNLCVALLAALERPEAAGRVYFILDGFRITWREFYGRQLEAIGLPRRFFRVPAPVARGGAYLLDRAAAGLGCTVPLARFGVAMARTSRTYETGLARRELEYRPIVGLEDGLADLEAWAREIGGAEAVARLGRAP